MKEENSEYTRSGNSAYMSSNDAYGNNAYGNNA